MMVETRMKDKSELARTQRQCSVAGWRSYTGPAKQPNRSSEGSFDGLLAAAKRHLQQSQLQTMQKAGKEQYVDVSPEATYLRGFQLNTRRWI